MASSRYRARVAISSHRSRRTRSLCALHVANNHGATRAGAHAGDPTAADRTHGRAPRRNGRGASEKEGLVPKCLTRRCSEPPPRRAVGRFGRIGSRLLQPTGRFRRRSLSLVVRPDSPKPLGRRAPRVCPMDQCRCLTQAPLQLPQRNRYRFK